MPLSQSLRTNQSEFPDREREAGRETIDESLQSDRLLRATRTFTGYMQCRELAQASGWKNTQVALEDAQLFTENGLQ